MSDPVQLASERFAQGFNCAQSILSAFAAEAGLSDEIALRMAAPFGGGIARQGETCGAVTGALMALGLLHGDAGREKTYHLAQEFLQTFRERHGSIQCHDLIGYDLSTPEGLQGARGAGASIRVCPLLVKSAAEMLSAIKSK